MILKSLEETSYEQIRSYVLHPEDNSLDPALQPQMDRIVSISKIMEKNPVQRNTIALHRALYPCISLSTAYRDLRLATRMFNHTHEYNYDLWHNWLMDDIAESIAKCRTINDTAALKVIAMEHANLVKALGRRPEEAPDPTRNEKHQFYILMQNGNQQVRLDISKVSEMSEAFIRELTQAMWSGQELTDQAAEEIMKT